MKDESPLGEPLEPPMIPGEGIFNYLMRILIKYKKKKK